MTTKTYDYIVEALASDGEWTIGYINSLPAQWPGNNEEAPTGEISDFLRGPGCEFQDSDTLYAIEDGRWVEQ